MVLSGLAATQQHYAEGMTSLRDIIDQVQAAEETRGYMQQFLGSEDQVLGTGLYSPSAIRVGDYANQYDVDLKYLEGMAVGPQATLYGEMISKYQPTSQAALSDTAVWANTTLGEGVIDYTWKNTGSAEGALVYLQEAVDRGVVSAEDLRLGINIEPTKEDGFNMMGAGGVILGLPILSMLDGGFDPLSLLDPTGLFKKLFGGTPNIRDSHDRMLIMGMASLIKGIEDGKVSEDQMEDAMGYLGQMGEALQPLMDTESIKKGYTTGDYSYFKREMDEVNKILGESRKAAESGDFDLADQLKAQAEEYMDNIVGMSEQVRGGITSTGDPKLEARENLIGPTARTIGSMLKESSEMLDRGSSAYMNMFKSLTTYSIDAIDRGVDMGRRVFAAEQRELLGEVKDAALRSGNVRNPLGEAAMIARIQDRAALNMAQVEVDAARKKAEIFGIQSQRLEEFRTSYALGAAQAGEALIANTAGIRDSFLHLISNLGVTYMNASMQQGTQWMNYQMQQDAIKSAEKIAMTEGLFSLGSAVIGAGATAGSAGMCWCAAEYYDWYTPSWWAAHDWIVAGWDTPIGRTFKKLYRRYGERAAKLLAKSPVLKGIFKPLFNWCRDKGLEYQASKEVK